MFLRFVIVRDMQTLARIIRWIDKGYADGVATSNYVMGMAMAIMGLVALVVDNRLIRYAAIGMAILTFVLFGWRMILSFRRLAEASDRQRRKG